MASVLSGIQDPVAGKESVWLLTGSVSEGEPVRQITLNVARFQVGRLPDRHLVLGAPSVSKVHAEFVIAGDVLIVRDLNSTNGTYVNGRRVTTETPLGEGDVVQFATMEFRVGRAHEEVNTRTIQATSFEHVSLLIQFDQLLKERGVVPHFQPIVALADRRPIGFEVLARSHLQGLENPRDMFLTAQRLNLESKLSDVCRWEGVRVGQGLPGATSLFLNTHPAEGLSAGLLLALRSLRSAWPNQAIVVEVHEASVTNPKEIKEFRAALRELDMQLAYDDFGAGQARLMDLVEVPPDYLKFDMSLIRGLHEASFQQQQMVGTLVRMVRDLGIAALAEGIECQDGARICQEVGFDYAQGYFFGRPAPVESYNADAVRSTRANG